MSRNKVYYQYTLHRPIKTLSIAADGTVVESYSNGYEVTVSWIPPDIAQVGRMVRLRNAASEPWGEGWIVMRVGPKTAGDIVEANERDYKHQREASDV